MTKRKALLSELADLLHNNDFYDGNHLGWCIGAEIIEKFIIDNLSTQERKAYDMIASRESVTARAIEDLLKCSYTQASTICKKLFDMHLVWREPDTSEQGFRWIYYPKWWTES